MFLVPKGAENFRAVVDYRLLNQRTEVESTPLPDINSAFNWFGKAKYFSTFDLNQAYHQIPLAKSSRHLTAFCTEWNLYQYTRVPFGLATGAQILTRLLDSILHDLKFVYVYHYLDDLVVYSESFEQNLQHVEEVLRRLRDAGLTVNPEKIKLAVREIAFLGHIVSPDGIRIDPERTRAIRDFPPPKDKRGIARFVGMATFYRKFVPNFAEMAEPLNILRKKGARFQWGPEQDQGFNRLKMAIAQPPVLRMADFSKTFIMQTDAIAIGLAAVLSQEHQGVRLPIAYASRTLTSQERKAFSVYELECLAVLFGIEKFRSYLVHREFLLETDNQALSWLLSHPRQLGKIGRWAIKISSMKFQVQHVRGTQNVIADSLSRMFEEYQPKEQEDTAISAVLTDSPLAFQDLGELQHQDTELCTIMKKLQKGEVVRNYSIEKGVLRCRSRAGREWKIVVPVAVVPLLFHYFHSAPIVPN
jgi:hypothetical protein